MINDEEKAIVKRAMSILGKQKSERKTKAVRLNAKRPRKRKKTKNMPLQRSNPQHFTNNRIQIEKKS
jgi:hypothetical protein